MQCEFVFGNNWFEVKIQESYEIKDSSFMVLYPHSRGGGRGGQELRRKRRRRRKKERERETERRKRE